MEIQTNKKDVLKYSVITITVFIVSISLLTLISNPSEVSGKVLAINRTWQGGDSHTFYNLTVTYQGLNATVIIQCNAYPVGSQIPIIYYPPGPLEKEGIGAGDSSRWYLPGCAP